MPGSENSTAAGQQKIILCRISTTGYAKKVSGLPSFNRRQNKGRDNSTIKKKAPKSKRY